ncbi:MAG TPA: oxalate/formate MFS antiporter [Burkholderiaceae bacterium]|nr:oxalate/formate MFS antiporter [Burkholderiaceae bacterium]
MHSIRPKDASFKRTRWLQLVLGLVAMMAISSPQYVWALFTSDLTRMLGVSLAEVQVTFALLIIIQTFLAPFQGFLIDRFGAKLLLSCGAVLTGLSWILASKVTSIWGLYLAYGVLGGLGTGIIYIGVIGLMVRWFPDKRGFAVGMVAAGYGFGAALTTFAISDSIKSIGAPDTLVVFGWIIGVVGLLAVLGLRRPREGELRELAQLVSSARAAKAGDFSAPTVGNRDYTPREMVREPVFWVMYVMFVMMATSGLMVISQIGAFAKDIHVANALVFGMAALPLALTLDRFTNGLTRPLFGWVSDHIGRENTMFVAFGLEGVAMSIWLAASSDPLLFALLSGVVFFGWGEIFSLFPATLTDIFGTKYATTNYGLLYMAQGVGSVLGGPLAAMMHQTTHSWTAVFVVVIAMNFITALMAIFVLKPMRHAVHGRVTTSGVTAFQMKQPALMPLTPPD